jgi:hypothetical protein
LPPAPAREKSGFVTAIQGLPWVGGMPAAIFRRMAEHNPYAPSAASLKVDRDLHGSDVDVWRDRKYLVMDRDARLPPRCVKCNEPAHEPTKRRTLYWHHPALYILILVQIIVYFIVALIVRKSIVIEPGLCGEHKRKRRNATLITWLGLVASLALPAALTVLLPPDGDGGVIVLGFAIFLVSVIYGVVSSRVLTARKIDANTARLGGCGDKFLESLPDYPR